LELSEAGDRFADFMFVQDNATRWNSAYAMIDRALKKRESIDRFIERSVYETAKYNVVPIEDILTDADWAILK
jgi:hypothetical protein